MQKIGFLFKKLVRSYYSGIEIPTYVAHSSPSVEVILIQTNWFPVLLSKWRQNKNLLDFPATKVRWREQLVNFPTKELWTPDKSMTRKNGNATEKEQIISIAETTENW